KWFADVVICAETQRLLCRVERAKTGEHDDGQMRIDFADLTKAFDPADSRHPNVHYDGVGLFFFEKLEAGFDAIRRMHLIIGFQKHPQTFARSHLVINNEDLGEFGRGRHSASAPSEARGMPRKRRRRKKADKLI